MEAKAKADKHEANLIYGGTMENGASSGYMTERQTLQHKAERALALVYGVSGKDN